MGCCISHTHSSSSVRISSKSSGSSGRFLTQIQFQWRFSPIDTSHTVLSHSSSHSNDFSTLNMHSSPTSHQLDAILPRISPVFSVENLSFQLTLARKQPNDDPRKKIP